MIETDEVEMRPGTVAKWLQGRLPDPVDDLAAWPVDRDGGQRMKDETELQ
jgi:hypothetical protein